LRFRFEESDWESADEVVLGCVNQAGEDNRNLARRATLLAGIPCTVPEALKSGHEAALLDGQQI
jgi:acetyl-CoA acetyltransferase